MSGAEPWLSVVMPTYNGERYVAHALESVRRQATDGLEIVVVDDGSTDGTMAIVGRYEGELPIRVVPHHRIGNWVATTNVGLRAARARLACFLHQDDAWLPGRVAGIRRVLDKAPRTHFLLHPAVFIGPAGERLGRWRCPLQGPEVASERLIERLLVQNFVAIPAPVFDRALALSSGGLDESLWYAADWDLWLRLGAAGPVRLLDEPLAAFRVHPESQTMARARTEQEFREQLSAVFERHFPSWQVQGNRRRAVERAARFSIFVNSALASAGRGERRLPVLRLASEFVRLRPSGWRRYLRDSRIADRVLPRLRLRRHPAA